MHVVFVAGGSKWMCAHYLKQYKRNTYGGQANAIKTETFPGLGASERGIDFAFRARCTRPLSWCCRHCTCHLTINCGLRFRTALLRFRVSTTRVVCWVFSRNSKVASDSVIRVRTTCHSSSLVSHCCLQGQNSEKRLYRCKTWRSFQDGALYWLTFCELNLYPFPLHELKNLSFEKNNIRNMHTTGWHWW